MNIFQSSFAGGEISESLLGNVNMVKYGIGARKIKNFMVEPFGGISNRPGMYFLHGTNNNSQVKLINFSYSSELQFLLEFSNLRVDIYKAGVKVWGGVSPYTINEALSIRYCQSGNMMFICTRNKPIYKLIHYADNNWKFEIFNNVGGAFDAFNDDKDFFISSNGVVGNVTLTGGKPLSMLRAGQLLKLKHYIPKHTIGDKVVPSPPLAPYPIAISEVIMTSTDLYFGSVNLHVTGKFTGEISMLVVVGGIQKYFSRVYNNSYNGKPQHLTYTVTEAELNRKELRTVIRFDGAVYGEKDNQVYVTLSTPGNALNWTFPDLPMKEIEVPGQYSGVLMNWTSVKGQWEFLTAGTWEGDIEVRRSIDRGSTYVVTGRVSSQFNNNARLGGAEINDGVMYQVFSNKIKVNKYELHACDYKFSYGDVSKDGICKINSVSGNTATATVQKELGDTSKTNNWAKGAWYDGNYPSVATLYQDRLVLASSTNDIQTIWFSQVGSYEDFSVSDPVVASDSITVTMSGQLVNQIRAIIPASDLVVMTNSSEFAVRGDAVLSPFNISARPQGFRGISNVSPLVIGNAICFVSQDNMTVRDLAYSFEADGYEGQDRSIISRHIFEGKKVVSMAYQQEPFSIVWVVLNDGTFASMTYVREQDVWAWATHDTVGKVYDVVVANNAVYFAVYRNGNHFIEYFDYRQDIFVDSALQYDGEPTTTVSGLKHLAGSKVRIIADGFLLEDMNVPSTGTLSFDRAFSKIIIGLPYISILKMLPVVGDDEKGTTLGLKKKVSQVTLIVNESRGYFVGDSLDRLNEAQKRLTCTDTGVPVQNFTGKMTTVMSSNYDDEGTVYVVQKDPFPIEILGVIRHVEFAK